MSLEKNILEKSAEILSKYSLCDYCLGRLFAQLGRGLDNNERGYAIKIVLTLQAHLMLLSENPPIREKGLSILKNLAKTGFMPAIEVLKKYGYSTEPIEECYVCKGFISRNIEKLLKKILLLIEEYEYNTFLIGARIPRDIAKREDNIKIAYGLETLSESFKSDLTRILGKRLQQITGKTVDYRKPEVIIIIDLTTDTIKVTSSPIFIYGRYRKYARNIPQNKWLCSKCWGKGCEHCSWTGKKYPTSVEEIVTEPIIKFFKAKKAKFHGAGREDVDVRMLGSGRPFVVEVINPKRRKVDLRRLEEEINAHGEKLVEVSELKYVSRDTVRRIKVFAEYTVKTYRAIVSLSRRVIEEDVQKIETTFKDIIVSQWTPTRVLHRRADKLRKKKVYRISAKKLDDTKL